MVDRHDYVALEWVKGEIAETLKQARVALDGYALQPTPDALAQCLACIHQVHGSLLMVEFYGAALLAQEMEQLVIALQHGRVSQLDEALRLLQQAFSQLPLYLDRVHSARRDWPLVVLPLLNDLRTARGETQLSETSLFSPALEVLPELDPAALARLIPPEWPSQLRTLRHTLHSALQGLLREENAQANLELIAGVFAQLERVCRGSPLNALWKITSALLDGMIRGRVVSSPALCNLLSESDKELKRLLEQGIDAVNQPAPDELLTRLLLYIAKAEQPTSKMLTLKNHYALDEAMPDAAMVDEERARLAGPDRDAMRSVVAALCEELVRVKERLDLFVRSDRLRVSELSSLMAPLRQIADTLAVLSFGQPRKVIIDQLAVVQSLAQGQREPTDAVLMDVAAALLYVEATLAGMVGSVEPSQREESRLPTTDLMQIHQLVIKEARISLEEVKDLISDYLAADFDRQHLQPLPALLTQIRGALAMIPLSRAASLLQACREYLCEHVLAGPKPPTALQLDRLADVLISLEYYLERLVQDLGEASERVLDRAEDSLNALGYAPAERQVPLLDDVLSPAEIMVMRDLQTLADPEVVQSLADVLASPESASYSPAQETLASLLSPPVDEALSTQDSPGLDLQLLDIFRQEAQTHFERLDRFLDQAREQLPLYASDDLQLAVHTLKGSAYMAGVLRMAELATALDHLVREYKAHHLALGHDEVELLLEAHSLLQCGLRQLDVDPLAEIQGARDLIERIEQRVAQCLCGGGSLPGSGVMNTRDPQRIAEFLSESMDILFDAEDVLRNWRQNPHERDGLDTLLDQLTTLGESAHLLDLQPIDALCEGLLDLYGAVEESSLAVSERFFHEADSAQEALINMLDQLAAGQEITAQPARIQALQALLHEGLAPDATGLIRRDGGQTLDITELGAATAKLGLSPPGSAQGEDIDREIVDIFLDEAMDIHESSGAALLRWQADPQNHLEVENLLRDLHTLKGGARMVEVVPIGDFAHELETLFEDISAGFLAPSAELFVLLQRCHDQLAQMLDALRSGQPMPSPQALIERLRKIERSTRQVLQSTAPIKPEPVAGLLPEGERTGLDTVKVPAERLEELLNLAGETSITRGRIEQQVNDGQVALNEMQTTLERMHDQLRRLDTETQGRIHSRQHTEADGVAYDEFDPLEMDRHSQLQQLSRALFESASDLLDLKATLAARNQDAQALLQKQGRVNTQLQEGLMGTRMVPFERVLPRLKRTVRQVASELNKQVEFSVINAEAEIDRNVLERMVAPLEHMLRNAVDHGLEPASIRHASGKPEQGLISLELSYEGGDVVFDMHDDGAGVPLEAVRRTAILRGLLDPSAAISDHEVLQFILQPGFSTAEKITQISGRGVGMDVVHEEVRQLGGSMTIDSVAGQGVHFQIRLPFSVSLNRALMVQCADEQYAIALDTVEGIVRVMPNELEGYYQLNPPLYHYGGQTYELRYLGELLKTVGKPKLASENHSLPVLLVHCQDQRVALQVDALEGSREIVVKSLGPQFTGVQGLSGATILGDGRVVLILDLLAYIRAHQARQPLERAHHEVSGTLEFTPAVRPPLVLVVDDSVTVRKVTSRLLERNGMNVITAKDGVDAMSVLEHHTPDLMLLDIEMPRMDGFEVATRVRNNPRLKDLPIIMITSRTGQKHQNRAMAIGVNDYLGKPYQESVLLERIAYWSNFHA